MNMRRQFAAAASLVACATLGVSAQRASSSPVSLGLSGYSLVLAVGDMQGGGSDTVPAAARKALADMQAFLPYKHYRLLDSEWIGCCTAFGDTVTGSVRGPDDRDYQYSIVTTRGDDNRLNLHFTLRDTTPPPGGQGQAAVRPSVSDAARAEYTRQMYEASKELDEAKLRYTYLKKRVDVGLVQPSEVEAAAIAVQRAERHIRDLQAILDGDAPSGGTGVSGRLVMDSTFAISVGETVVIGTSRLRGADALIALLTAARAPGRD
jgi:hypothetical protein